MKYKTHIFKRICFRYDWQNDNKVGISIVTLPTMANLKQSYYQNRTYYQFQINFK